MYLKMQHSCYIDLNILVFILCKYFWIIFEMLSAIAFHYNFIFDKIPKIENFRKKIARSEWCRKVRSWICEIANCEEHLCCDTKIRILLDLVSLKIWKHFQFSESVFTILSATNANGKCITWNDINFYSNMWCHFV